MSGYIILERSAYDIKNIILSAREKNK